MKDAGRGRFAAPLQSSYMGSSRMAGTMNSSASGMNYAHTGALPSAASMEYLKDVSASLKNKYPQKLQPEETYKISRPDYTRLFQEKKPASATINSDHRSALDTKLLSYNNPAPNVTPYTSKLSSSPLSSKHRIHLGGMSQEASDKYQQRSILRSELGGAGLPRSGLISSGDGVKRPAVSNSGPNLQIEIKGYDRKSLDAARSNRITPTGSSKINLQTASASQFSNIFQTIVKEKSEAAQHGVQPGPLSKTLSNTYNYLPQDHSTHQVKVGLSSMGNLSSTISATHDTQSETRSKLMAAINNIGGKGVTLKQSHHDIMNILRHCKWQESIISEVVDRLCHFKVSYDNVRHTLYANNPGDNYLPASASQSSKAPPLTPSGVPSDPYRKYNNPVVKRIDETPEKEEFSAMMDNDPRLSAMIKKSSSQLQRVPTPEPDLTDFEPNINISPIQTKNIPGMESPDREFVLKPDFGFDLTKEKGTPSDNILSNIRNRKEESEKKDRRNLPSSFNPSDSQAKPSDDKPNHHQSTMDKIQILKQQLNSRVQVQPSPRQPIEERDEQKNPSYITASIMGGKESVVSSIMTKAPSNSAPSEPKAVTITQNIEQIAGADSNLQEKKDYFVLASAATPLQNSTIIPKDTSTSLVYREYDPQLSRSDRQKVDPSLSNSPISNHKGRDDEDADHQISETEEIILSKKT
jgi:hypothetical protein